VAGSAEAQEHARRAERNGPRLRTHDRYGRRIDEVELDPSWHWLLRGAVERAIHSLPWREPRPGTHVARAALELLWTQADAGVMCPVSMTYSAVPALRVDPGIAAEWEPRLTVPDYDRGALCGMAMTEKQGGSDVRAGTTRAEPAGDGRHELTGHKWFCSHPSCELFLVLAQAPGGLSCFVVERGPGFEIQRLKDKLGTRSLASSEIELRGAPARLLGEEGRGVATIIEMVTHTRLDCIVGSAATMRRGVAEAVHHARHRSAFGAKLAEQPLMVNVLADLALESEAATATALRLARAYDEDDRPLRRFGTAVMKYWICKRATQHAAEALECLGGNGYVEESPMPRLLRDAPLNGIWEGSGNVISLDVLRALAREPDGLPAFLAECERARGGDRRLDAHLAALPATLDALAGADGPWLARRAVEDLAVAFEASLLVRHAPPPVADGFCAGRLGEARGRAFGTLPRGVDGAALTTRALAL
jgi:putative acyl-CoA dehydrogenase